MQQPDESNPYEEVYKDSSTFLKVRKLTLSYTHHYIRNHCDLVLTITFDISEVIMSHNMLLCCPL